MGAGRLVVIAPGPTANGDVHLGHIAGPFLAADVCARYARATGQDVLFGTGVHATQNYIVTTARRLGVPPEDLRAQAAELVEASLRSIGVDADGFVRFDDAYQRAALDFFTRLHDGGHLRLRSVRFPYATARGEFLTDAYVRGGCPFCLADGCAGLCESCGHWVASGELIGPTSTQDPEEPVELRERTVLVLPLEEHRAALTEYFAGQTMRPRMAQVVAEMLARPLPDYPITLPIAWGIPAPFPEVAGQAVYSDAETAVWSVHCTALSAAARGENGGESLWRAGSPTRVVYFLGSDASSAFAVVGTAMLLALGEHVLPDQFVTNEFYELDNDKFSTSRGHLVTARELADEVPRDLIRFYLAATSPEFQRTNFTRESLVKVTRQRLVEPWNRVATRAEAWIDRGVLPVSARSRAAAGRMTERLATGAATKRFSTTAIAFTLTEQLGRLDRWAVTDADAGDFCHEVDVFLRCAAPILVDLAAQALPDTAIPAVHTAVKVVPRALPRLTGAVR